MPPHPPDRDEPAGSRHRDILVVGAGISGIGIAHYLAAQLPGASFAVLEAREAIGGTWDVFRYPGLRSDSDLHTFGYAFRPWREETSIASGEAILRYLDDTVAQEGLAAAIILGRRVLSANWSPGRACWVLAVQDVATGQVGTWTCRWLVSAAGYYRYDEGHTPQFPGLADYTGILVHPQHWPADLDWAGKSVVVIGSGATAITLVPALAQTAAHVTMLQRTPTYVISLSSRDGAAQWARRVLGDQRAHQLVRARNARIQQLSWLACRRFPRTARRLIRRQNIASLPPGYPVDVHFNPPYDPWDQRLCIAPDGDFFTAIRAGRASVVTDRIAAFTPSGVALESGKNLEADIVVTATGLDLLPFGGIEMSLDGTPVELSRHVAHRGVMLDGIPNFAYVIGYTNGSWTMKVGLVGNYLTRLLRYMAQGGYAVCCPRLPAGGIPTAPLLDFGAGYVQRSADLLPRQGRTEPWRTSTSYFADVRRLVRAPVDDGNLAFSQTASGALLS